MTLTCSGSAYDYMDHSPRDEEVATAPSLATCPEPLLIAGQEISRGLRTAIFTLRTEDPDGTQQPVNRIARVRLDPSKDDDEIACLHFLQSYYKAFLPDPTEECISCQGQIRNVVTSERIDSPYLQRIVPAETIQYYFDRLPTLEEKILFLHNTRTFLSISKELHHNHGVLPDLVGRGNIIPHGTSLLLLDFNNINAGVTDKEDPRIQRVPLDDKEFPTFDYTVRFLYHLEKSLLISKGDKVSTVTFNKEFRSYGRGELSDSLHGVLVDVETLHNDPFYGSLRIGTRRSAAEKAYDAWLASNACLN